MQEDYFNFSLLIQYTVQYVIIPNIAVLNSTILKDSKYIHDTYS